MMSKYLLVARHMFRQSWKSLVIAMIMAILVGPAFVVFFPSIGGNADSLNDWLLGMPPEILATIQIADNIDLGNFESFLSLEYFSFFWAAMYLPFAASWGIRVAREAEQGTLAILLSHGISRLGYVVVSLIVGYLFTAVMIAVAVLAVYLPGASLDNVNLIPENWLLLYIAFTGMSWLVLAFSHAAAVIFMRGNRAAATVGGVLIVTYFIDVFAHISDEISDLRYLSPWNFIGQPQSILLDGEFAIENLIYFVIMIALCELVALYIIRVRDISPK